MPDVIFPLDSTKPFTQQQLTGHNRWHPDIPPVVRATPDNLREVLQAVLRDPSLAGELGRAGREYAVRWHDGHATAKVLSEFMEL